MKTFYSLITRVLLVAAIIGMCLVACKKTDEHSSAADREDFASVASESDAEAETVFDDDFNNAMGVSSEVGIGGTGVFGRMAVSSDDNGSRLTGVDSTGCYTVTTTQLSTSTRFPLKITIDFGAGCMGSDGRYRKGKIIIIYTGKLTIAGNSASITFDGYYINDIKVEGTHKITNTSTADRKSYTTEVIDAKLTKSNGDFSQWNSSKTVTQVEGGSTPLISLDDVFNITGQANGAVMKNGKYYQWSTAITEPLVKRYFCHYIVKGSLTLKKGDSGVAVLDYGTGICDNKATFTVNGVVHEITLH